MKKIVICLVLMGAFVFAVKLTFAQDAQPVNENDPQTINQAENNDSDGAKMSGSQGNADEMYVPVNAQDNSDVTIMPFVPQDNSENAVLSKGNEDKNYWSL